MHSLAGSVVALVFSSTLVQAQGVALPLQDEVRSPSAAYALFGLHPGGGGIEIVADGPVPEIFLSGIDIFTPFWHVLRHDGAHQGYADSFVSPVIGCGGGCVLSRLLRGDFLPRAGLEVALLYDDYADRRGLVQGVDAKNGQRILEFQTSAEIYDAAAADLQGNGLLELVIVEETGLLISAGDGTLLWQLPSDDSLYGTSVAIGQLDDDPSLEIATSFGKIIDASTRTVQWDAGGFAQLVAIGQLDADRPAELVLARSFGTIRALDVDQQREKWSFDNFNTSALRLADLDRDGLDEVLVGDEQFGGITIHDGATLAVEGFLPNLDSGVTDIQVADVDQDGELEIVWGSGSSSTGTDEFFVSDATTLALEWRAPTLGGPMVGPGYGDVDGDGTKELVVAGTRGRFDFIGGPQLVFLDERSLAPLAISPPLLGVVAEIHDLVLSDLDGDGDDEIVIAGGDPSRPYFRIYDVGAGFALTQIGGAFSTSGMSFRAVAVADADGNGRPEVLVCSGGESSGNQGNRVYAFEPTTGVELRHSAALGSTFDFLETIVVGDIDLDGVQEVAALLHGGQVAIFTGTTLATEAILPGTFTSLALAKHGLLVGDTDGVLRRVVYDGVGFTTVSSQDLGDRAITGIVPRPHGTLLVASDGLLTLYGSGLAKRVWHTDDYGPGTGHRVLSVLQGKTLVTCGKCGVFAFEER